jgi:hypothetical protein
MGNYPVFASMELVMISESLPVFLLVFIHPPNFMAAHKKTPATWPGFL